MITQRKPFEDLFTSLDEWVYKKEEQEGYPFSLIQEVLEEYIDLTGDIYGTNH